MVEIVIPAITGISGVVLGAWLKYHFDRRIRREFDVSAEITILKDRAHLYTKTAEVLRITQRNFLDTTWGPMPRNLTEPQSTALAEYLRERDRARERGVECHELFAGEGREARINAAKKECENGNFLIKIVNPTVKLPYMPDFAVADTNHVIISNVGATHAGRFRYVYMRSEGLAQVFNDWYWECWVKLPGEEIGRPPAVQAGESNQPTTGSP